MKHDEHDALATTLANDAATAATFDSMDLDGERYRSVAVLGRGGMGEVRLCVDERIGREIARKVILPEARGGDALARFVREAKVQARLEHPSIVPVYDMGRDDDGTVWFTMKRVRGRSLESVLDALASGDPDAAAEFSRRKLLGAFVAVCYAIAFAHEHGVVHRDLKPGNVMLGRFGEVSVLDWGIAKISGVADAPLADAALADLAPRAHATELGVAVGTPGYMAPEQARGAGDVGPAADVYALGAILFEMLALAPLHVGTSAAALMIACLREVDARPSARGGRDVPPELDAICVRATRLDPAERTASARELAEAVERYLDGDRDLERRRELAAEHTERAIAANDRVTALLELGRALALDPASERARDLLAQRLIEIPDEVPPDAREELETERAQARRVASQRGALRYVVWCAFSPLVFWMGIRDVRLSAMVLGFMGVTAAWAWWMARRAQRGSTALLLLLAVSSVTVALVSGLFGPLTRAEQRLFLQAWHLRATLPAEARAPLVGRG